MAQVLGPCTPWETRRSTWLLASDQRGARPLEGEPIAKGRPFSLSLSLSLSTLPVKKRKRKLLMIISQKDTFHSFFQHFSYNHMLEKIKSYVNCVLNEKSSAFLRKAAAKVVESKRARTMTSQDKSNGNDVEMETETNSNIRKSVNDKQCMVTESSEGTVSLLRSHKNLLSKLKYRSWREDFDEEEERGNSSKRERKHKTEEPLKQREHMFQKLNQ